MNSKWIFWFALIVSMIIADAAFYAAGYAAGLRSDVPDRVSAAVKAQFADDVKEVRQGKLAGAVIAASGNASLSEAWEELTSDVIREVTKNR